MKREIWFFNVVVKIYKDQIVSHLFFPTSPSFCIFQLCYELKKSVWPGDFGFVGHGMRTWGMDIWGRGRKVATWCLVQRIAIGESVVRAVRNDRICFSCWWRLLSDCSLREPLRSSNCEEFLERGSQREQSSLSPESGLEISLKLHLHIRR